MRTLMPLDLLRSTRRLTVAVVVLLSIQLSGNLYEELVVNVGAYADPQPGSVGELEAGSPLFYYLPWVPIGLALAVVLVLRLHRIAPVDVARRGRYALGALVVAVIAKAVLIARINPEFRRDDISLDEVRSQAVVWGVINGVAIVAVAVAIVLLISWRSRMVDQLAAAETSTPETAAATRSSTRSPAARGGAPRQSAEPFS